MVITTALIKSLNPCEKRLAAFEQRFPDGFSGTAAEFLQLDIPLSDRLWVATRLVPADKLRFIVADCAELVLNIYEAVYPGDNRNRAAIKAARSGKAVRAAAYAADAAARAAARAAHAAARAAGNEKGCLVIVQRYLGAAE